ncbi:hypothetical protein Hanom_Chr11g01049471 [Helianthus anomalus]
MTTAKINTILNLDEATRLHKPRKLIGNVDFCKFTILPLVGFFHDKNRLCSTLVT